jgi:hypothetical protein
MNIIKTTAPISIENLKKYFVDKDTFFHIDYKSSSLKGKKLLTYLSNLEIPSDIDFTNCSDDEFFEVLQDYFLSEQICNIKFLERAAITVLKEKSGVADTDFFKKFIENNTDIIDQWLSKIYSLSLFNMYVVDVPEFKQFVSEYPLDTTDSLVGVNFLSLLKHEDFCDLYQKIDQTQLKFYKTYFEEYMFKGKNLYSYWANENNPMFLLTFSIASGTITGDEYAAVMRETIEELKNATPV